MSASSRFFRALWLPLLLVAAAADEQGEGCSSSAKRCGNVTMSGPFWLADEEIGRSCGSPDFVAVCDINFTGFASPVLRSAMPFSDGFAVLDISYEDRSLHVIDVGKLHVLQVANSCHVPIWNSSVKLRPSFRIDAANLNLIFYNCTEKAAAAAVARRDRRLARTTVKCGNEWEHCGILGHLQQKSSNLPHMSAGQKECHPTWLIKFVRTVWIPLFAPKSGGALGEAGQSRKPST
ncbi:hypothetical protein TRIUR3_00626 [Triticum urartu]|uniref:Wall-associated receptor kinase galacturonan-binding domain-containing protein n=1 Tax=Triticum urartu TaxID=4572 RepID=M7ZB16_TRIUA|nr:hypothetical protein TRIUR3_00626 [Triticum urartu]